MSNVDKIKAVVEKEKSTTEYDVTMLASLPTTSAKIRYLDSLGIKRSRICKLVFYKDGRELRYQHVRNVLITPLKK